MPYKELRVKSPERYDHHEQGRRDAFARTDTACTDQPESCCFDPDCGRSVARVPTAAAPFQQNDSLNREKRKQSFPAAPADRASKKHGRAGSGQAVAGHWVRSPDPD